MTSNKFLVVALAVALVLSVVAIVRGGPVGPAGQDGQSLGAVPVLNSPLEVNGSQSYFSRIPMRTATSTVCVIKTPTATSTGEFTVQFATHPAYAGGYQIANATTAFATTTDLGFFTIPSSGNGWFVSSTTREVFSPNTYIVVKYATTSGTTVNANFAPTGTCGAQFKIL